MHRSFLTIGILGGMGPAATADLFQKIIKQTPASKDQEHLRIFIDNNPHIPDRTAALNGSGEDPSPAILESALVLQRAGADFIIVPCNTAHFFVEKIKDQLAVPVLSMIKAAADYVKKKYPKVRSVGLLATSGTATSGVYARAFAEQGIDIIVPGKETQEKMVMEAIYGKRGIKAGFTDGAPREQLKQAAAELEKNGAELLLMACTEIPLALRQGDSTAPLLDPTDILAEAAVKKALNGEPGGS